MTAPGTSREIMTPCALCHQESERILWRDERARVVQVVDASYPGFCRVIWNAHIKEMTELRHKDREHFMAVVFAVEQALRDLMKPDKINLASLGNQTPHLHWHVIPRFTDDTHFPDPIWAPRLRDGTPHPVETAMLAARIKVQLGADPA